MEPLRQGDKVLRVRLRSHHRKLRLIPNIPGIFRFLGEVTTKIRNTLFVTLGLSFLFLGEDPPKIWSPY